MADEVIYRGYNEEIDVNMVPGGPMSVWHSSQYDELRKLRVNLYNGKALQYLGSGVTVSLSVRKTDGNIIESSDSNVIKIVTENPWGEGSAPWRFIEINTTQQMTACVGKNICEIVVYETIDNETSRVGSANFILEVEKDPLAGGIRSDSEIDDLQTMVDEAVDTVLPTKNISDIGDVDLSYTGEGDFIIRNQSTQKWESRPHYQYKKDLTAGNTTISQTIYLVTEDTGKEFEVFIYGDSYDRPAPTSVNVTLGSGGATVTVEATIPAQNDSSAWLIELVICRGYNSTATQDKWFLKAQAVTGGGGGGGHTIVDNSGTSLEQRSKLQFKGAYSDDNMADNVTEVNVVRNMTKAEFDLLPAAEKVGLINITDITSGRNDRFQPVICSEEEQEIGVWINGKPLYKRTIVKSFESGSRNLTITFTDYFPSSYYIEGIFDYSIVLKASDSGSWAIPDYDTGGGTKITSFNVISCNLSRSQGTAWGNTPTVYLTIYYSKTDDTAGSGKWTPQGVPAVHYSTDEQIVGTWIDGKTLYQKVVTGLSINVTNEWTNALALSGIDTLVTAIARSDYGQREVQSQYYNSNIQLRTATGAQSVSSLIIQYTKATS